MKPKITAVKIEALTRKQSTDECCMPVCGPDTCGGVTSVSVKPLLKARTRSHPDSAPREAAATGGCCEPMCGPDTCG